MDRGWTGASTTGDCGLTGAGALGFFASAGVTGTKDLATGGISTGASVRTSASAGAEGTTGSCKAVSGGRFTCTMITATAALPNVAPTTRGQMDRPAFDRASARASILPGGRTTASDRNAGGEADGGRTETAASSRLPTMQSSESNSRRASSWPEVRDVCPFLSNANWRIDGCIVWRDVHKTALGTLTEHVVSLTHGSKAHSTNYVRLRFVPWCCIVEVSQGEVLLHLNATTFSSRLL